MRVTIESPIDTIVLSDVRLGETFGWHLLKDGLAGWYEPTEPRMDVSAIPQMDGAYWPGQVLASHRVLTVKGVFVHGGSSLEGGKARDRIAALSGVALTVCVEDSTGPRWVEAFVSSQPDVTMYPSERDFEFALILTCPDPVRYGMPVSRVASGGVVTAENLGTAYTWPTFDVAGSVTMFRATLGSTVLEWQGSSVSSLHIDTRMGVATSGGVQVGRLTHDDLLRLPPTGMSQIQVATTPAGRTVTMTARSGWK